MASNSDVAPAVGAERSSEEQDEGRPWQLREQREEQAEQEERVEALAGSGPLQLEANEEVTTPAGGPLEEVQNDASHSPAQAPELLPNEHQLESRSSTTMAIDEAPQRDRIAKSSEVLLGSDDQGGGSPAAGSDLEGNEPLETSKECDDLEMEKGREEATTVGAEKLEDDGGTARTLAIEGAERPTVAADGTSRLSDNEAPVEEESIQETTKETQLESQQHLDTPVDLTTQVPEELAQEEQLAREQEQEQEQEQEPKKEQEQCKQPPERSKEIEQDQDEVAHPLKVEDEKLAQAAPEREDEPSAASAVQATVEPVEELLGYTPSSSSFSSSRASFPPPPPAAAAQRAETFRPPQRARPTVGDVERRLLELHREEAHARSARSSQLLPNFAMLFDALPTDAVGRVRAVLDSSLVFRQDNSAADMRSICNSLPRAAKEKVLRKLLASCPRPAASKRGFVVLSDVDDTLLPGHDLLQVSGSDRSWPLDGRLYPGVSKTHCELRGGLRDEYGVDYSVLLTARPPAFVRGLGSKLRRIALRNSTLHMAILPGEGGVATMTMNAIKVLTRDFTQLGTTKTSRVLEYAEIFPDYVGRFVFIGDDGQADLQVAEAMLGKKVRDAEGREVNLVAFVAVKVVQQRDHSYVVAPGMREAISQTIRKRSAAPLAQAAAHVAAGEAVEDAAAPNDRPKAFHRFFYFMDYADLSNQLFQAGWIEEDQHQAILRGVARDKLNLSACMQACDLKGLRTAIQAWAASGHEADEAEQELFEEAGMALPTIMQAHLAIAPPMETGVIRFQLQGITMLPSASGLRWPSADHSIPTLVMREIGGARPGIRHTSDECGVLSVPWPCPLLFKAASPAEATGEEARRRGVGRAAIDVKHPITGAFVGRCFLIAEESSSASRDGSLAEAALLAPVDDPDATKPIGELTVSVRLVTDRAALTTSSGASSFSSA